MKQRADIWYICLNIISLICFNHVLLNFSVMGQRIWDLQLKDERIVSLHGFRSPVHRWLAPRQSQLAEGHDTGSCWTQGSQEIAWEELEGEGRSQVQSCAFPGSVLCVVPPLTGPYPPKAHPATAPRSRHHAKVHLWKRGALQGHR